MRLRFLPLLAPALATSVLGAQPAAPRVALSADTLLLDEVVRATLSGLAPGSAVTVRLAGLGPVQGMRASATFRADAGGRVDLATAAPIAGDYRDPHPMALFWWARRDSGEPPAGMPLRAPDARHPPAQPWEVAAEVDGRVVAADTVWRLAVDPKVRMLPVRERGLVGIAYVPPGAGPHPAVLTFGGSEGGIAPPRSAAGGLASRGYVVLTLGYFAAEGRPPLHRDVPLEYFEAGIRWLAEHPAVDSTRIGVLGVSRGAEAALLLGATYPTVRAVVAYHPSHVVWPGTYADSARAPAWTLGGRPVARMDNLETPEGLARHAGCPGAPTCAAPLSLHHFLARLDDRAAEARAEIPVERIGGPVLLVSGRDDMLWPATLMAERVVARLRRHGFRHRVEHLAYPGAGHAIARPYGSTAAVGVARVHEMNRRLTVPGGTPEGTGRASEDAWRRVLAFLDGALAPRRQQRRQERR